MAASVLAETYGSRPAVSRVSQYSSTAWLNATMRLDDSACTCLRRKCMSVSRRPQISSIWVETARSSPSAPTSLKYTGSVRSSCLATK